MADKYRQSRNSTQQGLPSSTAIHSSSLNEWRFASAYSTIVLLLPVCETIISNSENLAGHRITLSDVTRFDANYLTVGVVMSDNNDAMRS